MARRGVITICLVATSGLLIWALHFSALYFFNTLACTRGFAQTEVAGLGIVPLTVGLATLAAMFATIGIVLWTARNTLDDDEQTEHFLKLCSNAVALISIIAIFWNAVPAFIVPACG